MPATGNCHVSVKDTGCACFGPRPSDSYQGELLLDVLEDGSALQEQGCVLWMSNRCFSSRGCPEVFVTYNFLSRTQTERVAIKLPKLDKMIMKENGLVACSLHVSSKDYMHLQSIQKAFVPLVKRMLEQIALYKGLHTGTGSMGSLLEQNDVVISFENGGFQLMKISSSGSVAYTMLLFNPTRGCMELSSLPQTGRSLFAGSEKNVIVHNLSGAISLFREGIGWPISTQLVEREPSQVSEVTESNSNSELGSSILDEDEPVSEPVVPPEVIGRKHCGADSKDDKGMMTAVLWEHGALQALVQMVAGLTWSRDSEVFELAQRAAEALLGNERVGSPIAETFIKAVCIVIKEKGTECLSVYKLLLAVLDIPSVKQAALKYRFMDTLVDQYELMTQDPYGGSSICSTASLSDSMSSIRLGHPPEQQAGTGQLDDGTQVAVQEAHSTSPDALWAATPTSSAAHMMLTGSEGTLSTLSLELADSSWGGVMRTTSPAPSSKNPSHYSPVYDNSNKPDVPTLTFYWLKSRDMMRSGAGSATLTTIGLPDGRAIVLDEPDDTDEIRNGLPPIGSRSAHVCKFTSDKSPTRVKKCNFDRITPRTVHAWGVPCEDPEETEANIAYQIKCAILQALLGFSALNMGEDGSHFELDTDQSMDERLTDGSGESTKYTVNPSRLVVSELLAPTWQVFPGEQPPVTRGPGNRGSALALAIVHEFACRPPQGIQSLGVPGVKLFMPQDPTGDSYHTLVGGVKNRLSDLMSGQRRDYCVLEEAVSLVNLLGEFVASSPAPALVQLVAYSCSDTFVHMETALFRSQRAYRWTISVRRVFHALLQLFKSMLERAGDAILWGFLIGTLLERSHWVRLVKDYSKVVLFADNLAKEHDVQELVCLRSTLWGYFKALASVVAQHREGCEDNITSFEYQTTGQTFGRDSLDHMEFLVSPENGMAVSVLRKSHWGQCVDDTKVNTNLHVQVLTFLKTLFSVPRNNFIAQNDTSMFYLDFHWSSFKRLYQEAAIANTEVGPVCTLHLQVIKEMMTHRWTHVFYQVKCLGILDLLSEEISLELREHTAKKLSAFLPPGSSLAMKSSLQDPSRQVPFPGTEYMVTEGELGGKRYVESVPQSRALRGKERELTPLEEATEDEGKALSPVASDQRKHPEPEQTIEVIIVDKGLDAHPADILENEKSEETKGEDTGLQEPSISQDVLLDGRISANKSGSHKVAGATDGRKVYRLKSQELPLSVGVLEPSALSTETDAKTINRQIHTSPVGNIRASMIPKLAVRQSFQSEPTGSACASTARIRAWTASSRHSEDFTSGATWLHGLEDSEYQQTSRSGNFLGKWSTESKIPRVPCAPRKSSREAFTTPRGRGRSISRGGHRGRNQSGSFDIQSPGTPAAVPTPASRNGHKLPIGKTTDPANSTKRIKSSPKKQPSSEVTTPEKKVASRTAPKARAGNHVAKSGSVVKKNLDIKATRVLPSKQKVGKESAARGPVLAPELQQPEPPQTKKAQQMDADKKEQGVDSLEKEEGKGARAASGIVPSLDLTRVLGVQNTPSSIVDVETKGSPRSSGSSFASSDSSRSSEFDFPDQADKMNVQVDQLQPGRSSLSKSCAVAHETSAVADNLRDPRIPYITPNSGFASEGDTSGPPTFGVVCRARPSREPPQRSSPNPSPVNFDFGHASVSSNRLIDSDDATSFVPPSDFEYTGDMSDDARRLHSLERKHYGYASSDGTLSVMETVPPCRPNIVPPIHFPGVGVVQGISRSCSVSSSRNSQGGRKKLHHRHSKNSIADSKKGFVPYRRQASGSRASMAESRRSMWDRPPTAMDTRSTLDSFCTEHRSGSSFQIPDDFDWTGDASDDCRRLEILERRQKKGDCVSSSSGLSFTDTMSEDMRMSPVPAMGFGVKKLTLPVSNNFARPPHSTTGKSRVSCRTPSDMGQGSWTRQARPRSVTNSRSRYISDFDDALDAVGRRMERMDQHFSVVQSFRTPSAPSVIPHSNHVYDSARRYNLPLVQYGNEIPPRKLSHSRKSSSTSGHNPPATSSFLYPIGGKHGFRSDGLNESPRMGPRPTDIWNQSLKPLWSQATSSSQRSVHYSALQWNLNETKGDCVGESEVNRLLSAGKARKEHEASRKKQCVEPAPNGPLCLSIKKPEVSPAQSTPTSPNPYAEARKQRAAYEDNELHTVLVEVLLEGVLLEEETRVNRDDERDDDIQKIVRDLPCVLLYHLNHDCALSTVTELRKKVFTKGKERSRLLRLLVRSLFPAELYKSNKRMAKGAFAHVHQCSLPVTEGPATCAAKVVDLPGEGTDEKTLLDLYSEISILEKFHGVPYICDLYDYGITHESAYLVMKEYKCSLLEWRQQLPKRCPDSIRLFLRIFRNIVDAVKQVHEQNVVHFDLKCSNILIDPYPDTPDDQVLSPLTEDPPFNVVIADFGEARSYTNSWEAQTVRNRGTEFNKSPEMLKISDALKRDLPEFDRRKRQGAGPPSDVWGLGCLMFELVTGQMLQYDDDWARFFVRVTRSALPVLSEEKLTLLDDQSHGVIIELLEFMLVRDQSWRPSVTMLLRRLDTVLNTANLPPYSRGPAQPHDIAALPSPVDRYLGVSMFGEIGEWHSDIIRLTGRHVLTSMSSACDPWILSKHYISMIVLLRGHQVTSDIGALRTATARANIELIEINIGSSGIDGDGIRDEHLSVLKNTRRSACVGLTCQPAYKRELVTLILKILKGECGYEHYGGLLELWRRLKT